MSGRYWNTTKFADWLRGTAKPEAASAREWRVWEQQAKDCHPYRYWLVEEGLWRLQKFVMWPIDKLYDIKYWFVNRYVSKTHALTSRLPRGQWHEFDTRILHCLFDELVDFVEVEKAWKNIICDREARKKYHAGFFASGWFRSRTWRCPEAGLDYLEWESKLVMDESWGLSADDPNYGTPADQALVAIETVKLYNWWKFERPGRPDPWEASGKKAYYEEHDTGKSVWEMLDQESESEEERELILAMMDSMNNLEQAYDNEDTEMLIRLIKIRSSLWT